MSRFRGRGLRARPNAQADLDNKKGGKNMRKLHKLFRNFTNASVLLGWLSFGLAEVFSDEPISSIFHMIARVLP